MSISLELSTIQYNSLQSAIINTQIDEFLRKGGEISSTAPFRPTPRPYGCVAPAVASVRRAKSLAAEPAPKAVLAPAGPKPPRANASRFTAAFVDSLREMAKTMTQPEVSVATGETANQLYKLASKHGFNYQPSMGGGIANLVHNVSDPAKDAENVERIKAFREIGVTRRQAAKHMGISTSLFHRLITDYEINYPKAVNGLG